RHKTDAAIHNKEKGHKSDKKSNDFRVSFPLRTNYMYAKVKRTLHHEIFAFTICLWIKSNSSPGVGTPFSYSVPGQANEVVLIEWGNNPMELLINDKAATLPLAINDAKWHHVCVTWSTRDGVWESYLDGCEARKWRKPGSLASNKTWWSFLSWDRNRTHWEEGLMPHKPLWVKFLTLICGATS
ncbi:unnamed protein product, partial [Staurois parvus]